jgi:hypothetical protein
MVVVDLTTTNLEACMHVLVVAAGPIHFHWLVLCRYHGFYSRLDTRCQLQQFTAEYVYCAPVV